MKPVIPGFRTFLKMRGRHLPAGARSFWSDVASIALSRDERRSLQRVEEARRRLLSDTRRIQRVDFGAGSRRMGGSAGAAVSIARLTQRTAVSPSWGRLLFKVGRRAGASRILELGTGTGLSAAYLQAALDLNGGGSLVTIEGDPELCISARETLASVSEDPGRVVEGRFADVLPRLFEDLDSFDLVFVDGHHDASAVVDYLDTIMPHLTGRAIVILDEIQPFTGPVRPAWNAMIHKTPVAWNVDLLRIGILRLVDTQ